MLVLVLVLPLMSLFLLLLLPLLLPPLLELPLVELGLMHHVQRRFLPWRLELFDGIRAFMPGGKG